MFFDYRKAFDTVPHRNLLFKLESLGINSYVLRWLTHYLCSISNMYVPMVQTPTNYL